MSDKPVRYCPFCGDTTIEVPPCGYSECLSCHMTWWMNDSRQQECPQIRGGAVGDLRPDKAFVPESTGLMETTADWDKLTIAAVHERLPLYTFRSTWRMCFAMASASMGGTALPI